MSDAVIDHISTVQTRITDNDGDDGDKAKLCSKIVGSLVSILSFVAMKLDCGQPDDAAVMKKV